MNIEITKNKIRSDVGEIKPKTELKNDEGKIWSLLQGCVIGFIV